jgi:hypothetical protein
MGLIRPSSMPKLAQSRLAGHTPAMRCKASPATLVTVPGKGAASGDSASRHIASNFEQAAFDR